MLGGAMSPLSPRILFLAPWLCLAAPLGGQAQPDSTRPVGVQGVAPPPEIHRLDFLVGRWENQTEFLDERGEVVRSFRLTEALPGMEGGYRIEPALGGWTIEGGVGSQVGRSWYRYDPSRDVYQLFASDFAGNLDLLEGEFSGDSLVLTAPVARRDRQGRDVRWRWVFSDITADSYRIRQFRSTDDGRVWLLINRQQVTRLPGTIAASAINENLVPEIARWIGTWDAQERETPEGRGFRFRFDLFWYDSVHSVIGFRIEQHFSDGEQRLLWEGTKGYDPIRQVTYSEQRSPTTGLIGRGVYFRGEDGSLMIDGEGFGPRGQRIRALDILQPRPGGDGFRTVTRFWRNGRWVDGTPDEWRPAAAASSQPGEGEEIWRGR